MPVTQYAVESVDEVRACVRDSTSVVIPRGNSTKISPPTPATPAPHTPHTPHTPALLTDDVDCCVLDMTALSGVTEYESSEMTITAWAGTRLSDLQRVLAEQGQYLPFDPMLVERGATLGGTVASGLNGPGALRFGGLRDFVIGVRYIDSEGKLVRGGGKVVKNAAGFDLPKLMIGSLGRLGVLIEITLKVFPKPESQRTGVITTDGLSQSVTCMTALASSYHGCDAIELEPPNRVVVRLTGHEEPLDKRMMQLQDVLSYPMEIFNSVQAQTYWQQINHFDWVSSGHTVVKIPITPSRVLKINALCDEREGIIGRYSVGGNVGWMTTGDKNSLSKIRSGIERLGLSGMIILGSFTNEPLIGIRRGMLDRVKHAMDPGRRFSAF